MAGLGATVHSSIALTPLSRHCPVSCGLCSTQGGSAQAGDSRASPPPPTPIVAITFVINARLSAFTETRLHILRSRIAAAASVPLANVRVSVVAGSVVLSANITVPSEVEAASVETSLNQRVGTQQTASQHLGLEVTAKPLIERRTEQTPAPDAGGGGGGGGSSGALGGVLGVLAAVGLVGGIGYGWLRCRGAAPAVAKPPIELPPAAPRRSLTRGSSLLKEDSAKEHVVEVKIDAHEASPCPSDARSSFEQKSNEMNSYV